MRRETLKARMLRALSGRSQEQMAEKIDVHPSLIAQIELGLVTPNPEHLEKMAREAGLSAGDGEELLAQYEALRKAGRWRGEGVEAQLEELNETLRDQTAKACRRLLSLPRAEPLSQEEDRERAEELWARLEKRSDAGRLALVEVAEEYRSRALQEKILEIAAEEAQRDPERAAGLERLAGKIGGV